MEGEGRLVQSIYFGGIGREGAERLLEQFGKEGSFLLRDSDSVDGALCLCVRKTPLVVTYRLVHSAGGWSREGAPVNNAQSFETLERLIESFRNGTACGVNRASLTHPLDKSQLGTHSLEPDSAYMEM